VKTLFFVPSLFLMFDAKGGEEDLSIYLFSYFLDCNMRLSTWLV
jgi:hypothetical protein